MTGSPRRWSSRPTHRAAAALPANDRRAAVRRAEPRLFGLRGQRSIASFRTWPSPLGMDHVRARLPEPGAASVDLSHERFGLDHNRCILCTRCVRVCDEIEGAHTWDVAGRGTARRVITDMNQPWGESATCTSCGKCVMACPTGALFHQGDSVAELEHDRAGSTSWSTRGRRNNGSSEPSSKQPSSPRSGSAAARAATCRSWTSTSS